MKRTTISLLSVLTAVAVISIVASQEAYAHGHINYSFTSQAGPREISIVLGHSNEPSFGLDSKHIWNGMHGVELSIKDSATKIPISGAELKIDKYFFKNQRSFDRADDPSNADAIETGVDLRGVFGEKGQYLARQVITDGIYGYHVYGTVNYFDDTVVPIDFTAFCRDVDGKFNSPEFSGGYGCPSDIKDLKFPKRGSSHNDDKDEDD